MASGRELVHICTSSHATFLHLVQKMRYGDKTCVLLGLCKTISSVSFCLTNSNQLSFYSLYPALQRS